MTLLAAKFNEEMFKQAVLRELCGMSLPRASMWFTAEEHEATLGWGEPWC